MQKGSRIDVWTIEKKAGAGGHGEVFFAKDNLGARVAIKILKHADQSNSRLRQRFYDEVASQNKLAASVNILPVIKYYLPNNPTSKDRPWFSMPCAETLKERLGHIRSFRMVVEVLADLSETLAKMHELGYSHRDIKPENIFFHNGKWTLGDFGLVDFPDKKHLTPNRSKLGPLYYIAPEMLNTPNQSDGQKADIYSLAKVFWKLASGFAYPIPGHHRVNIEPMTLSYYADDQSAFLLDGLLDRATSLEPDERVTANEFRDEIRSWLSPKKSSMGKYDVKPMKDLQKMIADRNRARDELHFAKVTVMAHLRETVNARFDLIGRIFTQETGLSLHQCGGLNPLESNPDFVFADFRAQIDRCGASIGLMITGDSFQERVQVEFVASQFGERIYSSLAICLCNDGTSTPKEISDLLILHRNIDNNMILANDLVEELGGFIEPKIAEYLPKMRERIIKKYARQ